MNIRLIINWLFIFFITVRTQSEAQLLIKPSEPSDSILHRIVLVGDAGKLQQGKNPVVDAITANHDLNNNRTTLLYLGDNVYTQGLVRETAPSFDSLLNVLYYQAQAGVNKISNVIFIPGNHDWSRGKQAGVEQVRRQGQWLDSLKSVNIRLLPREGCPGPEVIQLNSHLVLVIVDTQWWLHPYNKPGLESDCSCKSEDELVSKLVEITYKHKDKGIILATHHPFRSYGVHGGYYTLKQHLFPLTDMVPDLYIPLPIIGSIYPFARGVIGNIQDLPNPVYKNMVQRLEKSLSGAPNVVFVAGHDHSLQHIIDGKRHYIVSGSGINRERVKKGKLARFVTSECGYVVLDHMINGEIRASFYTVDEAALVKMAYSAKLFTVSTIRDEAKILEKAENNIDSIRVSIEPHYNQAGPLHRFLLGENYRKEWAAEVTLPIFNLNTTKGGFEVIKQGGGLQTKSLRLRARDGHEWVLRTVQKQTDKILPNYLRPSLANTVLQDEISAANPFAPLTVPPLAHALGINHSQPTYYYVPDDTALEEHRNDFANTVCILEERNPISSGKTISTEKLINQLEKDLDNRVDQRMFLRARLLDLLIGDWDRHEDQWRWSSQKNHNGYLYIPIPRDRDQVYFQSDGLLMKLASMPWIQPKFQGFSTKLPNVNGFMFNGRFVDRMFLTELDTQDWLSEIKYVQEVVTDSLLELAISKLPPTIQQLSGKKVIKALKSRRDNLFRYGMTYYRFLSKSVDITGSDKAELFRVELLSNKSLSVSVYKLDKKGSPYSKPFYKRTFQEAVTREVRLYGRGGNDHFEVTGNGRSTILIRLIGGKGNDNFSLADSTRQLRKPFIYDYPSEENIFPGVHRAHLKLSEDPANNSYDTHSFKYDRLAPLLSAKFNYDDGLLVGVGAEWTKRGFHKAPFASQHKIGIGHSLTTNATFFRYDGQFTRFIGKNDLWVSVDIKAPNNIQNFFGIGNETVFQKENRIRYYRTRFNLYNMNVFLRRQLTNNLTLVAGPIFQHFNLNDSRNRSRFIESYRRHLSSNPYFQNKETYLGIGINARYDTRGNKVFPSHGMLWTATVTHLQALESSRSYSTQIEARFSFYQDFNSAGRFVIASRLGGGLTLGNPAFYQLQFLGGQDNLYGFRNYRFSGSKLLFNNLETRIKLFDFQSVLFPGSLGLTAFSDVGRVWTERQSSRKWHHGYGAGVYVMPAQLLVISGTMALSSEGLLPYCSIGFRF